MPCYSKLSNLYVSCPIDKNVLRFVSQNLLKYYHVTISLILILLCVQYKDLKWHMKDIRVWKRSYSFKFNTYVAQLLWRYEWNTDRQLYKEFCNTWGKIVENCKCQAFIHYTCCLKFHITKIPAVWPIESWNYAKKGKNNHL